MTQSGVIFNLQINGTNDQLASNLVMYVYIMLTDYTYSQTDMLLIDEHC